MKIVITGSRDWEDGRFILARFWSLPADTLIIEGEAPGADTLAKHAALALGLQVEAHPALWTLYGRRAGILRNIEMLNRKPDLVIAFRRNGEASRGTTHCLAEARLRGIPIELHEYEHRGYISAPGGLAMFNRSPISEAPDSVSPQPESPSAPEPSAN